MAASLLLKASFVARVIGKAISKPKIRKSMYMVNLYKMVKQQLANERQITISVCQLTMAVNRFISEFVQNILRSSMIACLPASSFIIPLRGLDKSSVVYTTMAVARANPVT